MFSPSSHFHADGHDAVAVMIVEKIREHLAANATRCMVAAPAALRGRQRKTEVDDLLQQLVAVFLCHGNAPDAEPENTARSSLRYPVRSRARALHALRRGDAEQIEPAREHARAVSSHSASRDARVASSGACSTGQFSKNAVNAVARS